MLIIFFANLILTSIKTTKKQKKDGRIVVKRVKKVKELEFEFSPPINSRVRQAEQHKKTLGGKKLI